MSEKVNKRIQILKSIEDKLPTDYRTKVQQKLTFDGVPKYSKQYIYEVKIGTKENFEILDALIEVSNEYQKSLNLRLTKAKSI